MVLVKQIGFKCVIQVHFLRVNLKCVVLKNFHTPPRPTERIGNSQGQGFSKVKNMSYSMDVTLFFCFVSKYPRKWIGGLLKSLSRGRVGCHGDDKT